MFLFSFFVVVVSFLHQCWQLTSLNLTIFFFALFFKITCVVPGQTLVGFHYRVGWDCNTRMTTWKDYKFPEPPGNHRKAFHAKLIHKDYTWRIINSKLLSSLHFLVRLIPIKVVRLVKIICVIKLCCTSQALFFVHNLVLENWTQGLAMLVSFPSMWQGNWENEHIRRNYS